MEISHETSSPHHHQAMGRVEHAIQEVKKILKKAKNAQEVTHGLNTYHDTPISDSLPSRAELFFNHRINTHLGLMLDPTQLDDLQKSQLAEKCAAHLKPAKNEKDEYVPNQPIWFTEDGTPEWRPGFIESHDPHPDSYWIVNEQSKR